MTYPDLQEAPACQAILRLGGRDTAYEARTHRRWQEYRVLPIITMGLQDFDEATGDAIMQLDAQTLRSSFERPPVLRARRLLAKARAAVADSWLSEGGCALCPRDPLA